MPAVACVQVPFGVLDPEAADDLFPLLATRPADVWARGVLGGGLLALAERDPGAVAGDPKARPSSALRRVADDTGLGLDQLAVGLRPLATLRCRRCSSASARELTSNATST